MKGQTRDSDMLRTRTFQQCIDCVDTARRSSPRGRQIYTHVTYYIKKTKKNLRIFNTLPPYHYNLQFCLPHC